MFGIATLDETLVISEASCEAEDHLDHLSILLKRGRNEDPRGETGPLVDIF